jgi:hypothetical protein
LTGTGRAAPTSVNGSRPPDRPKARAPNPASGSVIRPMGRDLRLASPVNVAVMGHVAIDPMIRRTPVPELPQSMTPDGSAKPPTPTPYTLHEPSAERSTSAPKARIAIAVSRTSCPSKSPSMRVSPTDRAPSIRERWLTDLSPGTSASPRNGPQGADVIATLVPCPAMPFLAVSPDGV